jgi:hypothetical protein
MNTASIAQRVAVSTEMSCQALPDAFELADEEAVQNDQVPRTGRELTEPEPPVERRLGGEAARGRRELSGGPDARGLRSRGTFLSKTVRSSSTERGDPIDAPRGLRAVRAQADGHSTRSGPRQNCSTPARRLSTLLRFYGCRPAGAPPRGRA